MTSSRKKRLRAVIGSVKNKDKYMNDKFENWIAEIILLIQIDKNEPQAAYICFVSGYI